MEEKNQNSDDQSIKVIKNEIVNLESDFLKPEIGASKKRHDKYLRNEKNFDFDEIINT